VSFDIDANGILQVSALDKTTGRQQSITVQEASNLSEDEIQGMIRAAEENAATDRLQRDRIEKRNRAEALTFKAERVLRGVAIDFGMQFGRDRRRRIENLIQELRAALEQSDDRGIDLFQSDLQNEVYELNREAYLYDLDDDGDGILNQIGGTLKRAFAGEDDDYYRTDDYGYGAGSGYGASYPANNTYGRQAQWDAPSWNQGGAAASSNSWDDWGNDWDGGQRQPSPPPAPGYNQPVNPSMPNGTSRYNAGTGYSADVYGRDNGGGGYDTPSDNRYGQQDSYGQDSYGQSSNGRNSYEQGSYGRETYDQNSYSQNSYDQSGYRQEQPQRDPYGNNSRNADYGQQNRYDSAGKDGYRQNARTENYQQNDGRQDSYRQSEYRQNDYPQDYRQDTYQGDTRQPDYRQSEYRDEYRNDGGYRPDDRQDSYRSDNYQQDNFRQDSYRPEDYTQADRQRTNGSDDRAPENTPRRSEREADDYWQRRPQPERDSRNTEDDWF